MNYLPPLRNYQQMIRVVKQGGIDDVITRDTFQLGNAFGHHLEDFSEHSFVHGVPPTEQRIRTLEVMALPSGSLRKPGIERRGGVLPTRSASGYFHQLNPSTQRYFDGQGGGRIQNRKELEAGTKLRTLLTPLAGNKHLYKNTLTQHAHHPAHSSHTGQEIHKHHSHLI